MVFKMHSNLYSKNKIYNSLMFCSCIHRSGKMLCGNLFLEKHVLNELRDLRDLFTHVLTSLVETTTSAFSAGCYTAVFSVVTQRSSQQTPAENQTTFLYRGCQLEFSSHFSSHVCGTVTPPITALLLSLPQVWMTEQSKSSGENKQSTRVVLS